MRVVVDSSVVVKWLVAEKEDWMDQALKLLNMIRLGKVEVAAPILVKYEVVNAIRYKSLTDFEKSLCVDNLYGLPIKYFNVSKGQAQWARELADKTGVTYYDAVFVELAKRTGSDLITANPKHQGKFPGVKVVALKDY